VGSGSQWLAPRTTTLRTFRSLLGRAGVILALFRAGRPLTRRPLVRVRRERHPPHWPGTIAMALTGLASAGELLNPRDRRGYRLPDRAKPSPTPDLFD
jgi:hypothetical protein